MLIINKLKRYLHPITGIIGTIEIQKDNKRIKHYKIMIRRNKKTRMYHAPSAKVTHMALESNFCQTVRFNVQVKEWDNINAHDDPAAEGEYFEDIIS